MTIIAASGFAGSGKTELSRYLVKKHGFTALSFADGVKDAVAAVFDWPRDRVAGTTAEDRVWREQPDPFWSTRMSKDVTPRWALQFLGTNLIRNQLFEGMWAERVAHIIEHAPADAKLVIDDLRFQNERTVLAKAGADFVIVTRPQVLAADDRYQSIWDYYMVRPEAGREAMDARVAFAFDNLHQSEYDWLGGGAVQQTALLHNNGTQIETWHNAIEHWYQENYPTNFTGNI